jgi:hypothetical protein
MGFIKDISLLMQDEFFFGEVILWIEVEFSWQGDGILVAGLSY